LSTRERVTAVPRTVWRDGFAYVVYDYWLTYDWCRDQPATLTRADCANPSENGVNGVDDAPRNAGLRGQDDAGR
jgi:hypothetical protein